MEENEDIEDIDEEELKQIIQGNYLDDQDYLIDKSFLLITILCRSENLSDFSFR